MKQYQKLFIGLSLLTFISCGSSGGGGHDSSTNSTPKPPVNGEVLKKDETSTAPIMAENGETQISNGNIKIDDKSKVAVMAENGGEVTNGMAGIVSGGFLVGMEASGIGSKVTNDGKVIGNSNGNIARSVVENYTQEVTRVGMKALNGGVAVNNGEISGKLSDGIIASGKGSIATNNGKVSSTGVKYTNIYTEEEIEYNEKGSEAIGMTAVNGGSVINGKDGSIFGSISNGMKAIGSGSIAVNNGNISSTGAEEISIYTDKDGIKHTSSGFYAKGMRAKHGASVINNGKISGALSGVLRADGDGSIAINNSEISSTGAEWVNTYTDKKGIKHIDSGNYARGMRVKEGASIVNGETGTISGTLSQGMDTRGKGSTAINNGSISSTGTKYNKTYTDESGKKHVDSGTNGGTGIRASEGAVAINSETGTIFGIIEKGMEAEGEKSIAVNNGNISSLGYEFMETYTDQDGTIHTSLEIGDGIGMQAINGGEIINEKTGVISGVIDEGMTAEGKGSTAVNNGNISSVGVAEIDSYRSKDGVEHTYKKIYGGTGMSTFNGSITNNGIISGTLGEGMQANGIGSTAVNNGKINFNGVKVTDIFSDESGVIYRYKSIHGTGISAYHGGAVTNGKNGIISGELVTGISGMGTNFGTITLEQIQGEIPNNLDITGMRTSNGDLAINEKGAFINLNGLDSSGMYAEGTNYDQISINSTIKNSGTININAENGIGMKAFWGATAINEETGIINLNNLNGTGMYAKGEGSTIENRGTIYLSGSEVTSSRDFQTAEEIAISGVMINGKDSKGNIGMKIDTGARMINKGHIVFGK